MWLSLLLMFTGSGTSALSQAPDSLPRKPVIRGYVKALNQTDFIRNLSQAKYSGMLHARLNSSWEPCTQLKLRLDLRQRLFFGNLPRMPGFSALIQQDDGLLSLSHTSNLGSDILWHSMVDRAWVAYRRGALELIAGRQRINWGINMVWNPNDVFNTFNFFDFDYEERPGCDGVRLIYTMPHQGALELAGVAGRGANNRKVAMLWRSEIGSYDVQLLGGYYDSLWFAGVGWAGNLRGAGFKGEANAYSQVHGTNFSRYIILTSATLDYTFRRGWYGMGSYLYNSRGRNSLTGFGALSYQKLSPLNLMPLKHQFALQAAKQFSPVVQASLSAIYGWQEHLSIFVPSVHYWAAQNWECTLLAQSLFARTAGVYQSLGQNIFLRLRFSF